MLLHGYNVHSSLVASRAVHDDMLQFAARHQIRPLIQKFEFSEKGLGEAIKHMKNGTIRYRGVLVAE